MTAVCEASCMIFPLMVWWNYLRSDRVPDI
jgi:hypothetical protein